MPQNRRGCHFFRLSRLLGLKHCYIRLTNKIQTKNFIKFIYKMQRPPKTADAFILSEKLR